MTTRLKAPPPKTGLAKYWLQILVGGWLLILVAGGIYLMGRVNDHRADKPPVVELEDRVPRGGLGEKRYAMLLEATQEYIAETPDASAEVREGKAFAPEEWLNEHLKEEGLGWRVRDVNGLHATIYEVS